MVEAANFVLMVIIVTACAPMLIGANGKRPFIVGYLSLSALFAFSISTEAIWGESPMSRDVARFVYGAVILVTVGWALAKERRK